MNLYFKSVEGKLFLLLGSILSGVGFLAVGIHSERKIEARESARIEKYEQALHLLSSSILHFERDAESKMGLALQYLKHDDRKGVPPVSVLKRRANDLGMSHLFVIDRKGRFIRSTNESPDLIPNLFSFSEEYQELPTVPEKTLATPLIPPDPEIRPYKFLTLFHHETNRFLHAGLRADYLETALSRMVASDPELLEVHILSPNGTSLGRFERGVFRYGTERLKLPELISSPQSTLRSPEGLRLLRWIDSSHPECGQCKKSGDLRDGRHQYLFSILIRNDAHGVWIRQEVMKSVAFCILWALMAAAIAYTLAKRFTKRMRHLNQLVTGSCLDRTTPINLDLPGSDEVSELARAFQGLLERIDQHQREALLVERGRIELDVARQVAHDLRSPLMTLEVLIGRKDLPEPCKPEILQQAISRIREVTEALLKNRDLTIDLHDRVHSIPIEEGIPFFPYQAIERIISEKRIEYSRDQHCTFELKCPPLLKWMLGVAPSGEFSRMMSNLINNAIEAYPSGCAASVEISLDSPDSEKFEILIRDRGKGMPPGILTRLGESGFTHGKSSGNGLGFHHAKQLIESLGGEVRITSQINAGTEVRVFLPRIDRAFPALPEEAPESWERIILVDDDPLIHLAWKERLGGMTPIQSFLSANEFKRFYSKNFDQLERALVLMDHEFTHEPGLRGLELLCELGLERQAILVTGRFDDPELLNEATRAGVRVYPKTLIASTLRKTG